MDTEDPKGASTRLHGQQAARLERLNTFLKSFQSRCIARGGLPITEEEMLEIGARLGDSERMTRDYLMELVRAGRIARRRYGRHYAYTDAGSPIPPSVTLPPESQEVDRADTL